MLVRVDLDFADHPLALDLLVELGAVDVAVVGAGVAALLPDADTLVDDVAGLFGLPREAVRVSPARGRDDASTWVVAPRPARAGSVWIVPEGHAAPGEPAVVIGDGVAFGTGLHATTALCLEALDEALEAGIPLDRGVLDVGTGTGILALAALALGAPTATAVDIDAVAVAEARANAAKNGMGERLSVALGGPEGVPGRFGLVLANILTAPLLELAPALAARVGRGGRLVLSGVRAPYARDVERAYRYCGLHPRGIAERGDWAAITLEPSW